MLKTLLYAVLLGVGMAACLSQQDENTGSTESEPTEAMFADTPAAPTTPSPETYVVEKKRVGSIRIGMPIDQLREQVTSGLRLTDTTLRQEGMQSTAYVVHPEGKQKGLLVEQSCNPDCQVWRISVLNSDFKTPEGISPGSKYSDIRKAYTISTVTFEEGNLVALAPEAGMSFVLDHSQLPSEQLPRLTAATTPANLLVKKILVY